MTLTVYLLIGFVVALIDAVWMGIGEPYDARASAPDALFMVLCWPLAVVGVLVLLVFLALVQVMTWLMRGT